MDAKTPPLEPIAITGFSFKMPQGAVDEESLWDILERGANVKSEWPADRATADAFYDNGSKRPNTLPSHHAHFMTEDPGAFDAPFFSITAKEASSMSPRQRQALEAAYHTFENAGIPVKDLRGSLTAVYGASMADDWSLMASKDPDIVPRMSITGNAASLLPNKVSWYFDLRGPSVHVDTACSSGMTALDLACQTILSGNATAALVFGSSTLLSPEASLHLANLNFLSPDGCSYSFDSRANGYGRGEGVAALYLKPLRQAVRDGDVVRAILRATGSNQDGRTPALTQPSSESQVALIRQTYAKAGLGLDETRYVEAHGTGTPTGDPIEANAVGSVFGKWRSSNDPLYLGSIKANIGHLEGSSGPAGVIKAVMMLERGIIPPQALFETLNPAIDAAGNNIEIPTTKTPWRGSGPRRISVNSFGFGGANSHAILDDALHYMRANNLRGYHRSVKDPASTYATLNGSTGSSIDDIQCTGAVTVNGDNASTSSPRLLVWSAADESAIRRMLQAYGQYYSTRIVGHRHKLNQLAYTLAVRRSIMAWRTFAVVGDDEEHPDAGVDHVDSANLLKSLPSEKPLRAPTEKTGIAFVFTGQGAQYAGMGMELLRYPVCVQSLRRSDEIFKSLGCEWSLFDAIHDKEKISRPEYSQPLCTALQIALVDLLRTLNITPAAVVGHSSGEIAAAYAAAGLSHESACKAAYFRGKLAGQLRATGTPGAMLSANLREDEVLEYLQTVNIDPSDKSSICLACVNSPKNVTLAGPAHLIDILKANLDQKGTFAQKLDTGVAYHSPAMRAIAKEYASSIGPLKGSPDRNPIPMVSSVTGQVVEPEILASPQYWVDNLVSPVRFTSALQRLKDMEMNKNQVNGLSLTDLIEIGPHAALRRPVKETLPHLRYHAWVQRSKSPLQSTLQLVGTLFCLGYLVSVTAANGQEHEKHPYLVDCPPYPFDHSKRYWDESRLSRNWRLREASPGFILGRPSQDWNPLKPRWRNWLCVETIPWLGDHNVTGVLVCPGTGSLVIAMEAVRQVVSGRNRTISGFNIRNVQLMAPLRVGETTRDAIETDVHLNQVQLAGDKESTWFEFHIFTHQEDRVTESVTAQIQVLFEEVVTSPAGYERALESERIRKKFQEISSYCNQPVDGQTFYKRFLDYGFKYGDSFNIVQDVSYDAQTKASATGKIDLATTGHEQADSPVHPAVLDGVLQVLLATPFKGVQNSSTMIPRRIEKAWISNRVWTEATKVVHAATTITSDADEDNARPSRHYMNFYAVADDGSPLCAIENVKTAEISRTSKPEDDQLGRKLLYSIAWKPRLSSLDPRELQEICEPTRFPLDGSDTEANTMAIFFPKMEFALRSAARKALQTVSLSEASGLPKHHSRYIDLLKWQSTLQPTGEQQKEKKNDLSDSALEALLEECEAEHPQWFLFPAVARALPSIIRGETNPLELLFATKAAEEFYASVYSSHMRSGGFRAFVDLASHEKPGLRILEAGAGTGSFTRHILSTLQALEAERGGTAFAEYVFTDISTSFFGSAQEQFKEHLDRMTFRAWDLERDPSDEDVGLDVGGYDVVFAGSVLHATSDLGRSLRHLRKLLRPGGYLVMQEITAPHAACTNIGFGSLEGWWLSTEEWRQDGPLVTQDRWDQLLRENGFGGIHLSLKDFEDETYHISTIMVAPASVEKDAVRMPNGTSSVHREEESGLMVIADQGSELQDTLIEELSNQHGLKRVVHPTDLKEDWKASPTDVVVSLVDVGNSRLANLSEQEFKGLQQLVRGSKNILWVAASTHDPADVETGDGSLPWDPRSGIATGFLRTVRSEESDKHIVTLTVNQAHRHEPRDIAGFVREILHSSFDRDGPQSQEVEFVVQDGQITIGRMVHEKQLDDERESRLHPRPQVGLWSAGPPLALEIEKPGMLDSLRFVEDAADVQQDDNDDLAADEVEIEAEAWPLSFRDVLIALGRIENESELGWECAGRVTRVGSACTADFRPGDRAVMGVFGSMRSFPRAKMHAVRKIPDHLSLVDAVAHVNPCMTAWHALVNIARLQKGEKVLIHSAAGSTGQMAVEIATMIGAEIFATVGSDDKKDLLATEFNIPLDHIFHSRDTSFAQGIARATRGRGVDVVMNSLAGESLRASWGCLAPHGRFIEIGKADILADSALPMAGFARNVLFAAVDLADIVRSNPSLTKELLTKAVQLVADGEVRGPRPLHLFPVAKAEMAFRFMQSGKNTGRVVITATKDDQVTKHLIHKSTWRFDADATYVVAGGLGGLGRVIIEWMVQKGAKHLLVPSRSGGASSSSPAAAAALIAKLRNQGIAISTPQCDVASSADLSKVFADHAGPPIRGCINATMALHDAVFANMTHTQWISTLRSKLQASWNLHTLLPPTETHFFVLLSSLVGVYGAPGQANYAAGCAFQDALARARSGGVKGGVSASLDLGWLSDAGIVSERAEYRRKWQGARDIAGIRVADLIAVLDRVCDPASRPSLSSTTATTATSPDFSQLLVGAITPADLARAGEVAVPATLNRPLLDGFRYTPGQDRAGAPTSSSVHQQQQQQNPRARFLAATSHAERSTAVTEALREKLARALGIGAEDVETSGRPVAEYGVDSLMAVELRNWMLRDYGVEVAVFEILGGGVSVHGLAELVVRKTEEGFKGEGEE